ncbi:hypothetical protein GF340_05475, partial [Candidatus Peregrinibacteria bacterium]|nr:hypothetical protein [Candidatus Peregrinibacteria bacterium]
MNKSKLHRTHSLFNSSRFCYKEKPAGKEQNEQKSEKPDEKKEDLEKMKPKGIPIDKDTEQQKEKAEKTKEKTKKSLKKDEKEIQNKFGGEFFDLSKLPFLKGKGVKSEVHINVPKNLSEFKDENGKVKKPRLIVFAHGNGGQKYNNSESIKIQKQVKKMRENGDPVILVMPQDGHGKWKDFEKPEVLEEIVGLAEEMTGEDLKQDISLSSFSGGNVAIKKILKSLRENAKKSPVAGIIYKGIKKIAYLDSATGSEAEEVAAWMRSNKAATISTYYNSEFYENGVKLLQKQLKQEGIDLNRFRAEKIAKGHGVLGDKFQEYLERAPHSKTAVLNIPEKETNALKKDQFLEKYRKAGTNDEKMQVWLEEYAKGNVDKSLGKLKPITVKKNGVEITFFAGKRAMEIGEGKERFKTPMDAKSAKALADMYDGVLPNKYFAELIEKNADKKARFTGQNEFAKHDDRKMMSLEYFALNNKSNNVQMLGMSDDDLIDGYFKYTVIPEPGVTKPGKKEIWGGIDANGKRVQGLSGGAHIEGYFDYADGIRLMANYAIVNGKPMSMKEIYSNAELARKLGFQPVDYDNVYKYDGWRAELVNKVKSKQPTIVYPEIIEHDEEKQQPLKEQEPAPIYEDEIPVPIVEYSNVNQQPQEIPAPAAYEEPSHATYNEPIPQPVPQYEGDNYEVNNEDLEQMKGKRTIVIGDSLSLGFANQIKDLNVEHVQTKNESTSSGAMTLDLLNTLKWNILTRENIEGQTLVVVGGSNDIFNISKKNPDSIEKITKNLSQIYQLAKEKGMTVVASTIPPIMGAEKYIEYWAKKYEKQGGSKEEYREQLKKNWNALNRWIR